MTTKYRAVIADIPWPVATKESPKTLQGSALGPMPYATMTVEEIRNFDIDEFADRQCILFLWTTSGKTTCGIPILALAFELIEKWNFTYRGMLYWQKNKSTPAIFTPIRRSIEPILFASRGVQGIPPYGMFSDIFQAPRGVHSQKPDAFYRMIRMFTEEPRITLFERFKRRGFAGWGNEYDEEGPLAPFLNESENQRPDIVHGSPSQREPDVNR